MAVYAITRHAAAAEWLIKQGYDATVISHADDDFWSDTLRAGDVLIGTLPMHLAAQAVAITGKPFGFLSVNVPPDLRGTELTMDQMIQCNARIDWFDVISVARPDAPED